MKLFSERKGIIPPRKVLQIESVDDALRNGLWNVLMTCYWSIVDGSKTNFIRYYPDLRSLLVRVWDEFFKSPLDTLNDYWPDTYAELRKFFLEAPWNRVYDFIEFVAHAYVSERRNNQFIEAANSILERERSAYRFVGSWLVDITSEEEIAEVEEALDYGIPSVTEHLNEALRKLADRDKPDFRNSIKESISAVESLCAKLANREKAVLSDALTALERTVPMHPALKAAFIKLYGYTSDAEGIRHALLEESTLQHEDATFVLITCSAFINYLVRKASKVGIKI